MAEIVRLNELDVDMYAFVINSGCNGVSTSIGGACDNENFLKACLVRGPTRGILETAEVSAARS